MAAKTGQVLHPYSVKIETPTGTSTTLPNTLLTAKQAEEVQAQFKRLAHDAGVKVHASACNGLVVTIMRR